MYSATYSFSSPSLTIYDILEYNNNFNNNNENNANYLQQNDADLVLVKHLFVIIRQIPIENSLKELHMQTYKTI